MFPRPFIAALSLIAFCIQGERTSAVPKDDGYLLISQVSTWRYELDVSQPEATNPALGTLYRRDGGPAMGCQVWFTPVLIGETQTSTFVRKDTLTPEQVAAFEGCITDGPLIEWSVLGPVQKYDHPEPMCGTGRGPEPEEEAVGMAYGEPIPPDVNYAEPPAPSLPKLGYIGNYVPLSQCPFLFPELIRA